MNNEMLAFLKTKIRWILWIALSLFLIFDIVTTTIGLQKGGYEETSFLIPFVGDPLHHLVIKIFLFGVIFAVIEGIIFVFDKIRISEISKSSDKNTLTLINWTYNLVYGTMIFVIILFLGFTAIVQVNNMLFILSHHSFL